MKPKYFAYICGSLFPYDRAIVLLADIRARGETPIILRYMAGRSGDYWYDTILLGELKVFAAAESRDNLDKFIPSYGGSNGLEAKHS